MALETSGFQLSQFDRAPNIPGNIGVVDTKAIYNSVANALKQNETLRTLQQVQGLTDAQTAYQTAQAQGLLSNLPDTLAADKAKSRLLASQATAGLGNVGVISEADRAKALYESALSTEAAKPANVLRAVENKTLTPVVRTQLQLQALLDRGGMSEEETAAIKAKLGQALSPAEQAKLEANRDKVHEKIVNGEVIQFTNSGAVRIPGKTEWMFGTAPTAGLGVPPTAGVGVTPTAGVDATATAVPPALVQSPATDTFAAQALGGTSLAPQTGLGGESAAQKRVATSLARLTEEQAKSFYRSTEKTLDDLKENYYNVLPRDKENIVQLSLKTDLVEKAIDDAIKRVELNSRATTGGGKPGQLYREWIRPEVAADFEGDINQVRSNIGFDALQLMRDNSKTGGALGNVSDTEGKRLESVFGELTTKLSPEAMIAKLNQVREARRSLLNSAKRAYETKKNFTSRNLTRISRTLHGDIGPEVLLDAELPTFEAAAPAPGTKSESGPSLEERLNKYQ